MVRAAVLIGVRRTGGLPELADAIAGAKQMEQWALQQGMGRKRVKLFTDEQGPLEVATVRRAIRELVDSGTIEQLIVYFAGHGVNIRYGEYWLFSEAPQVASEAVNVEGSMALARRCGIPQVVLISDACRTAAEGVQGQGVTGTEIFPNDPAPGPECAVDIFFATTLGRPALEIKDPGAASAGFKALYTAAFVDAASGKLPAAVTPDGADGRQRGLVRPRRLKKVLFDELPKRIRALSLPSSVSQIPDARITSGDDAWIAELAWDAAAAAADGGEALTRDAALRSSATATTVLPDAQMHDRLLVALQGGAATVARDCGQPRTRDGGQLRTRGGGDSPLLGSAAACGIRSIGSDIEECISAADVALDDHDFGLAQVKLANGAVNALVRFSDGSGMLLPAVAGCIATVTFEDGEVTDLVYEPTAGDVGAYAASSGLHAVVAQSARSGLFRLEPDTAALLTQQLSGEGPLDLTLALYAAYALHDIGQHEPIAAAADRIGKHIGATFFDLQMLRPAAAGATAAAPLPLLPPLPMLARGWALTAAHKVRLDAPLEALRRELLPSVWTHFNRAGTDALRELFTTGRLR